MTAEHCFICAGADDDEGFDECGVCGRRGVPRPPAAVAPKPETALGRAVRLARGEPTPDDVPEIIKRWTDALKDVGSANPREEA